MKTIARIINSLFVMLFAASCGGSSQPFGYEEPGGEAHTIAYLKSLCPPNGTRLITQTIDICGTVTANDWRGEYYKSIVLQDATGGIEISIDGLDLASLYPRNTTLKVYCNGLAIGDYGGKPLLGAAPNGNYTVDRIPADAAGRYLRPASDSETALHPALLQFSDVAMRHVDTYVRFEGVRFEEQGLKWCDTDPETGQPVTTRRTLIDAQGHRFTVRTLGTYHYAKEPIPQGTGSINGIIDYFNGEFSLRIVGWATGFPD